MNILAIDTTSEWGSLAIRSGGALAAETHVHSVEGFAHVLFPNISALLTQAGLQLDDIDCFAAASGPGAFTGVRVGLAAAKGLAEAQGKSAVGISNLRAAATVGTAPRRGVVLDARRGEVFAAIYGAEGETITPEVVTQLVPWLDSIRDLADEFVLPPEERFRELATGQSFAGKRTIESPRHLAPAIAQCAELSLKDGRKSDPAALDANYVRRSDAELFWQEA